LKSFKTFLKTYKINELFTNDDGASDIASDPAIHASIHNEGNFMRNFDEIEIFDTSNDEETKSLHKELMDHYKPHLLSEPHKKIIKNYTSDSEDMNGYLWKHRNNPDIHAGSPQSLPYAHIKKLTNIINDHHAPKDIEVWSSTRHDPRKLKDKNDHLYHPAFLSTSHKKIVAESRDQNSVRDKNGDEDLHILHFTIPKDHPSLYVAHPRLTKFPNEAEILLPPRMKFKYNNTTLHKLKGYDQYNDKQNEVRYNTHHLEIVK